MFAPQTNDLAGNQHHLDAQNIVGGEAVFQTMHPTGIFRHIAANGTGNLRRGVGRVIKAFALDRFG